MKLSLSQKVGRKIGSIALIVTFSFCLGFFASPVYAQQFEDVSISATPEYPKIGDNVTVTVDSSEINLDFLKIAWYLNGKYILSGQAATSMSFTVDKTTPKFTVRAVIGDDTSPIIREMTISPGDIILLWEAVDSYRPSWYLGKALMPAQGLVRVTAVPVGSPTLDKLFFLWKLGGNSLPDQSGFGRNSIVVRNNILLDSVDVSVEASLPDGSFGSAGSVTIPRSDPDIRLWSSALGQQPTYEHSGTLAIPGSEGDVEVLPYGMSSRSGQRGIGYDWKLNGIPYEHPTGEADDRAFLSGSGGPISVDVTLQSLGSLIQAPEATKTVTFR